MVNLTASQTDAHHSATLDETFAALSDPTRRTLIARLSRGEQSVSSLAEPLPMSLVAVSKHLAVLERAGLVVRHKTGRTTMCALAGAPLRDAAAWIEAYRGFWDERLDALETYLAEEDEP